MKIFLLILLLAVSPSVLAEVYFETFASKAGIELSTKSADLSEGDFFKAVKNSEFDWEYNLNRDLVNFDGGVIGDNTIVADNAVMFGVRKSFKSEFWTQAEAGIYARSSFETVDVTYHVSGFAMKQFDYAGENLMVEVKANSYGAHAEKSAGYRASVAGLVDVTRHLIPANVSKALEDQGQDIEIWAGLSYTRNHNFDLANPSGLQLALRMKSNF